MYTNKTLQSYIFVSLILLTALYLHISSVQTNNVQLLQDKIMTQAGVSLKDSILFENQAAHVTVIDFPEELPTTGDRMCAYIAHDTMFMEYYHGHKTQKNKFQFTYNN